MGHVPEPPPRPGESEEAYLRRIIQWHHAYGRQMAWQVLVAFLGACALVFLLALTGMLR